MKKRILYLSALSSQRLIDGLYQQNKVDPGFAVQKFNRLLVSGLIENLVEVTVLSAPPVGRHNSSKVLWHRLRETEKEITYSYLNFINFSLSFSYPKNFIFLISFPAIFLYYLLN